MTALPSDASSDFAVNNRENHTDAQRAHEQESPEQNPGDAQEAGTHPQIPGVRERVTALVHAINLSAVIFPFVGLIVAIVLAWGWGFSWLHLGLLVGMYYLTGFGITVGYHRLFTHRSFETYRPIKLFFALAGSMAIEGPLLKWVANHRRHHQHSDEHDDPHSPNMHGGGVIGVLKGLWHAHVGWIFGPDIPNLSRYVGDLLAERWIRRVSALFPLWAALSFLIPTALGGLITMTWTGALLGFIWGGLARVFLVHHVTWSINSVCHLWGSRPFRSHDESRNNVVFGLLAMGEGWHNNHHAFPTSAKHGLRWWEFDGSYLLIRGLELLGLAWKVKVPTAAAMSAKMR
ncbi:MAG TPA: fatty acid desaturase [Tepidisphaeraceae bacterium]|nr:fatty acid desaturase [Tepidisphaeraceae bacterium]